MEGYSVTEAASVLGVPTERVWELLARGVLSGVPDGETGMRVFLQPRPAPTAVEEPRRTNGGSTHEREPEASPFRELLSEFRNLTERYGQALLALGEARGEVASLRSRVDLLEARFDLRLPMSGPIAPPAPSTAGWGQPTVRPMPETHASAAAASDAEAAAEAEVDAGPAPRRRRRRGQHRATDDFAEALARAEDPSPAELPGGAEAAAAFAALRDQTAAETPDAGETAYLRELPAAEPMAFEPDPEPVPQLEPAATLEPVVETALTLPVESEPDEVASIIEPAVVEAPLPEAEPETTQMEAGPLEPAAETGATAQLVAHEQPISDPELPEAVSAFQPDETVAVEPEPEADAAGPAAPALEAQVDVPAEVEPEAAPDPEAGPKAAADVESSWDRDRYTARIEEPDWIPEERSVPEPARATEPEPSAGEQTRSEQVTEPQREPEPEFISVSQSEPEPEPEPEPERAEPVSWDADAVEQPGGEAVASDEETPTGEETMLWFGREPNRAASAWPAEDDFAAEMEVSTGGSAGAPWVGDEPVTFEADRALTARTHGAPEQRFVTPPHLVRSQPLTSPASRAYRRLRRIFPG